jgi:DNA-binding transcriptional MerR regulator
MTTSLKVGTLAGRTGLTVRTLHHYDEIGLLSPSERTRSGHRLYGEEDVARLQQIASLKHLGLPLEEIRACLALPEYTLDRTLELQLERLDAQITRHEQLRDRVARLRDRLRSAEDVSVEDLTRTIEITMTYEKYYTPEQLKQLERRAQDVGQERIEEVQREWTELFAAYTRAMEAGQDPASDEVQALARKSNALVAEFTGGDPGIRRSLQTMYQKEGPAPLESHGMSMAPGLWEYMGRARAAFEADG